MASVIIRMEDDFKKELSEKAKSLGLSLSAYIRSTMKEKVKKEGLVLTRLLSDTTGDLVTTGDEFLAEIERDISQC